MRLNIIVCDDESIALKINCTYIEELAKKYHVDVKVFGFLEGNKVVEFIQSNRIDIAFLDIDLNGESDMNGLDVAAKILKKFPRIITIFITGHREYAYEAFTVEAFGYLTKPINQDRLDRIFKKAIMTVSHMNIGMQRTPLLITEDNLKKKISQSSILYIERILTKSIIVTRTANHAVYETVTSLAERLGDNFIRVNQGVIVNFDEIMEYNKQKVTMKTGEIFSIGRTYRKEVIKQLLE